jgi:hypothetical protein
VNRRALLAAAGFALTTKTVRAAGTPVPDRAWRAGPPMPVKRSEFGAATLGDSIIVAGGFDAGAQVDAFDGAWRRLADLPKALHHAGVAALDGKLYVAGGYDASGNLAVAALHIYDPDRNVWDAAAALPEAKGAFGFVAANGHLYALGGAAERLGGPARGAVDRYDVARDRWETIATLPTPREHLAAAVFDGAIYTIGGRANGDESVTYAAAVERFDLATGRWSIEPPLPTPRAGLAAAALDGVIVTAGGERGALVFAAVEVFDPVMGAWTAWPALPTARHGVAMAITITDQLVVLGGSLTAGQVDSVKEIDLLSGDPVGTSFVRPYRHPERSRRTSCREATFVLHQSEPFRRHFDQRGEISCRETTFVRTLE